MARVGWLLFVVATIALVSGLPVQDVDAENRALKIPGGPEAQRLEELARIVPDDPTVLLACATRGNPSLLDSDRQSVEELVEELIELPGVHTAELVDLPDPGIVLIPVALVDGDGELDPFVTGERVRALAEAKVPPTLEVLATGLPMIEGTIAQLVAGERTTIVPILLFVLLAAAWFAYGRLSLAVAVLLPALSAIAWTGGAIAWLGHDLDPVAALLDPVLLTIGVAASVHFVEGFQRARVAGLTAAEAVREARRQLRKPAFWATLTTMLGLLSLTINDTPAVRDFGVRAALGVALAHLFTFVLLPAWLPFSVGERSLGRTPRELSVGAGWVRRLLSFRLLTVAGTAAAVALAAAGLGDLKTENDPLNLLPKHERSRADYDTLAARLGGVEAFHLLVREGSPASEPNRLLPFLAAVRYSDETAGLAGPVQRGVGGELAVPMLLRPSGSTARARRFDEIERTARVLGLEDVAVAGRSVRIARDSVALMNGLLDSLLVSLLVLTTVMAIGLRSLRLALAAMVPNLLPSLWLYGGLGCAGRPLSVATAMIGCTMLGLIVDNTLHLLHHYHDARRSLAPREAMAASLDRCGRAITLSTIVLLLGFLTTTASSLSTTVEFGLLASATIAMAWFGTAVLLPTLLLSRSDAAPTAGGAHAG